VSDFAAVTKHLLKKYFPTFLVLCSWKEISAWVRRMPWIAGSIIQAFEDLHRMA